MPEVANCPVCGEEPRIEDEDYPYYSYHCCGHAVYADDKVATQWNRYAAAMELARAEVAFDKAHNVSDDRLENAVNTMADVVLEKLHHVLEVFK